MKQIVFGEKIVPRYTMVLLTLRCHQRCTFCSVESPQNIDLNYSTLEKLLLELKSKGGRQVGFSGGEPFLYPYFYDAVMEARILGLKVSVTTTGTFIDNDNISTVALFINELGISLHGKPKRHDKLIQFDGGYSKVIRALELLKRNAPHVAVTLLHTVTKDNIEPEQLTHVIDIAENYGHSVFIARAINTGHCEQTQMLDSEQLLDLVERVYRMSKAGKPVKMIECIPHCILTEEIKEEAKGCGAGIGFGCVDQRGEVKICPQSNTVLGLIDEETEFSDIWLGENAREFRNGDWLSPICKSCSRVSRCRSGCHVETEALKDFYASDYYFRRNLSEQLIDPSSLLSKC